jgi:hypothetical protein
VEEASVGTRHRWRGHRHSGRYFRSDLLMKVELPPELDVEEERGGGVLLQHLRLPFHWRRASARDRLGNRRLIL